MKKYLLLIGAVILASVTWLFSAKPVPPFGGVVDIENQFIKDIGNYQDSFRKSHGKFKQFHNKQEIVNTGFNISSLPFDVRIDEYQAPNGVGYQLFLTRIGNIITATGSYQGEQTKSIGFGPEIQQRTWDWKP